MALGADTLFYRHEVLFFLFHKVDIADDYPHDNDEHKKE
jgi:hypothetical protein